MQDQFDTLMDQIDDIKKDITDLQYIEIMHTLSSIDMHRGPTGFGGLAGPPGPRGPPGKSVETVILEKMVHILLILLAFMIVHTQTK